MTNRLNLWLLLIVAVCGASYWFGRDLIGVAKDEAPQAVPTQISFADDTGPNDGQKIEVHLLVLNGTDQPGLAREFGLLLGRVGCVAEKVGNAPHDHFAHSFLVNRQLDAARIEQLAVDLGGIPVLVEFDGRSSADAVLVLGDDAEEIRRHLSEFGNSL